MATNWFHLKFLAVYIIVTVFLLSNFDSIFEIL